MIRTRDEFFKVATFLRRDGTMLTPDDEFTLDDVLFEPHEAQSLEGSLQTEPDAPRLHIWTLVQGDEGLYLESAIRRVNRIGYLFVDIAPTDERFDPMCRWKNGSDESVTITYCEAEPCGHDEHEDCMNCGECGCCSESLDNDDICAECVEVAND